MINSTTVEVTWNPPSITNGILRYYTVGYSSSDDVEMIEVNYTDMTSSRMGEDIGSGITINFVTLLVSGLDPFTNYTFYVLAATVAPSEPSDSVTVRTDEGGWFGNWLFLVCPTNLPMLLICTYNYKKLLLLNKKCNLSFSIVPYSCIYLRQVI